jgi:hypothetical protein
LVKKNTKKRGRFGKKWGCFGKKWGVLVGGILTCIPNELEVMCTIDTKQFASHLDLHLKIDNRGRLKINLYNKGDGFIFPIVNFPFMISNILAAPAYGVYISKLVCYFMDCAHYSDFLDRYELLTQRLFKQGYVAPRLKS